MTDVMYSLFSTEDIIEEKT